MSIKVQNYCKICNIECSNKCSICKTVYYCTKEHQKLDWTTHKCNCSNMKEIYDSKKQFRKDTKTKLLECLNESNFSEDVINALLYLLNISMKDETKEENRRTFMYNDEVTNKIKNIGINLGSFVKMQNVVHGIYIFNQKYPNLTNIMVDSCLLNYVWNNINGWMS